MQEPQNILTETHHALLFACMVKAVFENTSEQRAEQIIRKAVRRYGEERGRRMALRAQANGHALSMANYLAYSEYRVVSHESAQKIVEKTPHARVCVTRCPWQIAWESSGLLPYGRFYCLEIDEAVLRGFNPALTVDVRGTQSNGAAQCDFVFRDANLTLLKSASVALKKSVRPGKKAVMPWSYHLGHLFSALEKTIQEELGETGNKVVEAGLAEFANRCGAQAAQTAAAGRSLDFSKVAK